MEADAKVQNRQTMLGPVRVANYVAQVESELAGISNVREHKVETVSPGVFGERAMLGLRCDSTLKVYKSQVPVIEQAMDTAALMLGTDKSRGYCLEMICADFLAGAHLDNGDPEILLRSISRGYKFLPGEQQQTFLESLHQKAS